VGDPKGFPWKRPADSLPRNRKWPFCANTSLSTCRFRICATSTSSIRGCFREWQKAFFENGAAAFESRRPRSRSLSKEEDKIAALEAKLRHKTEVLAEVVEELVRTKKELGES
jgi:hypothetical protein